MTDSPQGPSIKISDWSLYRRFRDKVRSEGRSVKWVIEKLMADYLAAKGSAK